LGNDLQTIADIFSDKNSAATLRIRDMVRDILTKGSDPQNNENVDMREANLAIKVAQLFKDMLGMMKQDTVLNSFFSSTLTNMLEGVRLGLQRAGNDQTITGGIGEHVRATSPTAAQDPLMVRAVNVLSFFAATPSITNAMNAEHRRLIMPMESFFSYVLNSEQRAPDVQQALDNLIPDFQNLTRPVNGSAQR
ncbi:MAG: hypothetical protein LBD82_07735, partial [Deltaproteobacteria bacterium]|nr:hypothetical protein [Deltaproteobacteria bacterium]